MSEEHTNNEDAVNNPAPEPDAPAESPEGASAAPAGGETTSDERTMGMLCHIAAFAGLRAATCMIAVPSLIRDVTAAR